MAIDFTRNLQVGLIEESTYNTYVASGWQGFYFLPGATFSPVQGMREEPTARGMAIESNTDNAVGLRSWTFSGSMLLPKEAASWIFQHMFGALVSTNLTGEYKHVHTINDPVLGTDASPQSLSMKLIDDNKEWQLSGGVVTEITVSIAIDNFVRMDVSMIGGDWADAAIGSSPTYNASTQGREYLTADDFAFALGGAAWTPESWSCTFARAWADGVAESYEATSTSRARLVSSGSPAPVTITGNTRRVYEGVTQFDQFDAFTEIVVSMISNVDATQNLTALDTAGYYFAIELAKCKMLTWDKEDSNGITMQNITWKAYAAKASLATDVKVTIQDSIATPADVGTP